MAPWLLIACVLAAALLAGRYTLHHRPSPPPPGSPWQWVDRLGLALGVLPDLPTDWSVDLDRVPKKVTAQADLDVPLGQLPVPLTDTNARKAWVAWREGRFQDAVEPAQAAWTALAKDDPKNERPLLAFLYAQTRIYAKDPAGAQKAARVAATHPLLGADALSFLAARADEQGQTTLVLTLLQNRTEPQQLLLRARAYRRNGQFKEAEDLLSQVQVGAGTGLSRKWQLEKMRLAHAQLREDEAVSLARELIDRAGKSGQTEEAVDFLIGGSDGVWQARVKKRPQDAPAVLDALVWTAQRRRYGRATPALEALAKLEAAGLPVQCHARSWAAHTHDRKGELEASVALLTDVAEHCEGADVVGLAVDEDPLGPGDAEWRIGRALLLQGKLYGVAHLKKALEARLGGLDAEDARTLLLLAALPDAGPRLKQHGATSANDYAERDIVDVMAWRFAMDAMTAGKWKDALKLLDRLADVRDSEALETAFAPRPATATPVRYDDRDWARGRADYFAGRALQADGNDKAAIARWQRVVVRHPLSYYAAMSHAQLLASGAKMPELPAKVTPAGPQWTAKIQGDVVVQRARLLGQLAWHEEAGDLLDSAGLGRDVAAADKWAAGDPGGAWVRAALDDEAARWTSSHAIGRDALRRFATQYPAAENKLAWQLTYPRAFGTLVEKAGQEFDLHPSIIWAIGRSESGFNPKVESHAAAIGLLQLILPTAQAMAKPLGLTADATTLRQPSVNVRLGARYLKSLLNRFDREAQMAAGYNAGGGAVGRWRKTRGDWPLDLFVEAIPFRETRDYAKRVVSAIAVYRNLYSGETLHAFTLSQKAVPTQDEPPTEPSSHAATPTTPQPAPTAVEPKPDVAEKPAEKPADKNSEKPSDKLGDKPAAAPQLSKHGHHKRVARQPVVVAKPVAASKPAKTAKPEKHATPVKPAHVQHKPAAKPATHTHTPDKPHAKPKAKHRHR